MLVLGLHGAFHTLDDEVTHWSGHDAAAVLVEDGFVLAAIEEERLTRVKHASYFPVRAVQACLDQAGRTIDMVDRFAFGWQESTVQAAVNASTNGPPTVSASGALETVIERLLGVDAHGKVRFCNHHLAHAVSAVLPSGLDDCLILVLDGSGDDRSGAVYDVDGGQLQERAAFGLSQSLGDLYTTCIGAIGLRRFEEYKAMGLAPYGARSGVTIDLSGCATLLPDGDYRLDLAPFEKLLEGRPPRSSDGSMTAWDKAFAGALQGLLVTTVTHVLDHHRLATGRRRLCLAGGVIHNCALNGAIARSGAFDDVFVQPAAHDAGAALGAALTVCGAEGSLTATEPLRSMALGPSIGDDTDVRAQLDRWGGLLEVVESDDIAEDAAAALAAGQIIGWVQGRSEFGPRSLGRRSILADPRPASNRDRVNAVVKQREGFRPFAPAVPAESLTEWFEPLAAACNTDFMNFTHLVRPGRRTQLAAVTHVDGTARVQTVDRDENRRFYETIEAFGRRTGVPVLLNTSFNGSGEPIVDSVDDSVAGLITLGLDALAVGRYLVRVALPISPMIVRDLVLSLPGHRRIVKPRGADDSWRLATGSSSLFDQHDHDLRTATASVLRRADGSRTVDQLSDDLMFADRREVADELFDLWKRRAVLLRPSGPDAQTR